MSNHVHDLIRYSTEGPTLDFKRKVIPLNNDGKFDLVRDVCAFVNHPSKEDKYIIFGVIEKEGRAADFSDVKLEDQATYQQLFNSCIEPEINFVIIRFRYSNCELACLRFYNNNDRPYLFREKCSPKLTAGSGYIRSGSSNRLLNRDDLELIYKQKHKAENLLDYLIVEPVFKKSKNYKFEKYYSLDLNLVNDSNSSVEMTFEIKVIKGSGLRVMSLLDAEKARISRIQETSWRDSHLSALFSNINVEEEAHFYRLTGRAITSKEYDIKLNQRETRESSLESDCLIDMGNSNKIVFEVTLRSDKFTSGPFSKRYEITV